MATLKELVKFRNDLIIRSKFLTLAEPIDAVVQLIRSTIIENSNVAESPIHVKIDQMIDEYQQLKEKSFVIQNNFISEINSINQMIDSAVENINTSNTISIIAFKINADINHLILTRMQKYADWRFPALRLGCGYVGQCQDDIFNGNTQLCNLLSIEYSNELVVGDPLYFCDSGQARIDSVTEHFNDVYQKRIRKYTITDNNLSVLPQNQFGFIFAWMQFNYWDLSTIEIYLRKIFDLLRPGGSVMFSYNNSDLEESAELVERNLMRHAPKRSLIKLCESIGFEIEESYDLPNADVKIKYISWLEARRPGKLHTIKSLPVLGKILAK